MIGRFSEHHAAFLQALAVVSLVGFGLPLIFAPVRWARLFQWRVPVDRDLVVYLGRCLGALVAVLAVVTLRAAAAGQCPLVLFDLASAASALMVAIHAAGAIARVQPWTETVEAFLWAAALLLSLLFRPVG